MLYPDFTANIGNMPIGPIESDYYDLGTNARGGKKHTKKRSKDAAGKNFSRVAALNQTEYFMSKQRQGHVGGMNIMEH